MHRTSPGCPRPLHRVARKGEAGQHLRSGKVRAQFRRYVLPSARSGLAGRQVALTQAGLCRGRGRIVRAIASPQSQLAARKRHSTHSSIGLACRPWRRAAVPARWQRGGSTLITGLSPKPLSERGLAVILEQGALGPWCPAIICSAVRRGFERHRTRDAHGPRSRVLGDVVGLCNPVAGTSRRCSAGRLSPFGVS